MVEDWKTPVQVLRIMNAPLWVSTYHDPCLPKPDAQFGQKAMTSDRHMICRELLPENAGSAIGGLLFKPKLYLCLWSDEMRFGIAETLL